MALAENKVLTLWNSGLLESVQQVNNTETSMIIQAENAHILL